jgi:hypothetical protein
MIKFVFILAVILPNGEVKVDSSILDQCPEKTLFTAQMEDKRIHREIVNWQARCYRIDVGEMLGNQS